MKIIKPLLLLLFLSNCLDCHILAQENSIMFINASSGLKLRATPTLSSEILGIATYGQTIELIEKDISTKQTIEGITDCWYKVRFFDKVGFMFGGFLTEEDRFNIIKKQKVILDDTIDITPSYLEEVPNTFHIPEEYHLLNVWQDKRNNELIKHYRSEGKESYLNQKNLVMTNDGFQKELGPLMNVRGYTNGLILVNDFHNKKIIQYDSNLEIHSSKDHDFTEGSIYSIGLDGHLVNSDEYEVSGSVFNIYNQNFELLNAIEPYDGKAFKYSSVVYRDNKVYILVSNRNNTPVPKLKVFDLVSGKIISNLDLNYLSNKNYRQINSLVVCKHNYIIGFYDGYVSFDKKGNYMWAFQIRMSNITYNPDLSSLLIYSYDSQELMSIQERNGQLEWNFPVRRYSKLNPKYTTAVRIEPMGDKYLLMLNDGNTRQVQEIVVINKEGELITYYNVSEENIFDDIFFVKGNNQNEYQLIGEKTYLLHEVPKAHIFDPSVPDKNLNCIFKSRNNFLPRIKIYIGDTINVQKITDWHYNSEITDTDNEIRKLIKQGRKFFQIGEDEKFIKVGFLDDENSIYIYIIEKENCNIFGKELIARETGWEHGYTKTYSIIENDYTLRRIQQTGARDWGDYTKWKRDTIIELINFDGTEK